MTLALYIVGIIILISSLLGIFYLSKSDNVVTLMYKINMCDKEINEFLDNKESLIVRVINIINRELKSEYKVFDKVKNIKSSKLNNYDRDVLLTDAYEEINKIYSDNPNLKDVKSFDGLIKDIRKNEIKLVSLRTLFNKCTLEFNDLYKKFPYGFICKLKKFKPRNLYQGKELNNEIDKELNFSF